ncbi:MAG: FtsX-like permease family protein [Myxococcales bacterium]|nr:FtsX-like permease family protein [Myxococcales bacterium]
MRVVFRIALRNLGLHWVRNAFVGLLLMLGAFVVVAGTGLKDAIDKGMRTSIIESLAGEVQVYSKDAKDKLELYGSIAMGTPDVGRIDDFAKVRDALTALPYVKAVVPMGVNRSVVPGRAILDVKLEELRRAYERHDTAAIPALTEHVRYIIGGLDKELDKLDAIAADSDESKQQRENLARAESDAFWAELAKDPVPALEFLDNKIAPLGTSGGMYFLAYVGTDLTAFRANFPLFEIVKGEMVPPGQRGFLINETNYERFIKHKSARRLDALMDARKQGRRIADEPELQQEAEQLQRQYAIVTDELGPEDAAVVTKGLQSALGSTEDDLGELVRAFLTVDDANLEARRDLFYELIAPRIRLYEFGPGDTLTLYAQTRAGYTRAVNVKIWGVYHFKGLEKSVLAGGHHLMDLVTFRELYGLTNAVSPEEVAALKARSGIEKVARDDVEADLFGGGELVDEKATQEFDALAGAGDLKGRRAEAVAAESAGFTQDEIDHGPVLNAAVLLRDGTDVDDAIAGVQAAADQGGLGLQAVSWRDASGLVGQLTLAVDFPFWGALIILYLVALIIINNSLVMATMDRLKEIGTLRAIGAQRGFVVRMFVLEAGILSVVAGVVGALLGALLLKSLATFGIPATTDFTRFIFGGDALRPALEMHHLVWAFVAIVLATLFATLYPALVAARVSPIAAMQAKE